MGNNLAATAPSQICSVDTYLEDEENYVFKKSMGSTRFMKVACATCKEGYVIIKVFANLNANLDLSKYKMDLEEIKSQLKHASNCLPFQNIVLNEKAALLVRQYVKYNLYDRISTRPFYNKIERQWIAFQLLCSLNQLTKLGLCHGDIKCENIMISSWNWLLLTDFASFKPVTLPDDNPANFNYFFDTSRRRVCYIAPERFVDSSTEDEEQTTKLLPSMDIFSAGCVLAELFTDGSPPFDLAQLLAFKDDKYYPNACLEKIENKHIRSLVEHMLQKDPRQRLTAEQYLTKWKGTAFPTEFYSFLKRYLGYFGEPPLLSADQTINYLYADKEKFVQYLTKERENEEHNSLVIVLSLVLSCMRRLRYCSCKLKALNIIKCFGQYLTSEFILERIIPYLLEYTSDKISRVKAFAIEILTVCMSYVKYVPEEEQGIFTEYIFPGINNLANDKSVLVRQTLAKNIAELAEIAFKFLDSSKASQTLPYDVSLHSLHEVIQGQIQTLLSDGDSTVRQCLLKHSVAKLCTLFGHQKSNDIVLSHMITFLNDKIDWRLRHAFFDSILEVALYIGWQSTVILKPLLQQGLNDHESHVISKTLQILKIMVDVGYFSKQMVAKDLKDVFPLVLHPCQWIRQNAVSVIAACVQKFNFIDVQCYMLPMLQPFLKEKFEYLYKDRNISLWLKSPLKQDMLQIIKSSKNVEELLIYIKQRANRIENINVENNDVLASWKLLTTLDINEDECEKITLFAPLIKSSLRGNNLDFEISKSVISLPDYTQTVIRRHAELFHPADDDMAQRYQSLVGIGGLSSGEFDSRTRRLQNQETTGRKPSKQKTKSVKDAPISMSQLEAAISPVMTEPESSEIQFKYTNCKLNLRTLVHHKRNLFESDISTLFFEESIEGAIDASTWQPAGILIGHINEHKAAINQIAVSPSHSHFSTVSSDCTMKLWDCNKLDGKSIVNMSKATYNKKQKLHCTVFCGNDKVACSSENGTIDVVDMNAMSSVREKGTNTLDSKHFSSLNSGMGKVVSMTTMQKTPLIIYITTKGTINAWDMRMPSNAWSLKHDLSNGLLTALTLDSKEQWLCVGTLSGICICWDIRFSLPVCKAMHPSSAGIRKIIAHPKQHSKIIASVMGNNEVSVWNLENSFRDTTLWASTAPALSLTEKTTDTVNGLQVNVNSEGSVQILTGGTDSRIRFWDTNNVSSSKIVSGPGEVDVSYQRRTIEGTYVVQEIIEKSKHHKTSGGKADDFYYAATGKVSESHRNIITDLAQINLSRNMLVSSSTDGIIKIWK